jgi:hypothetical protein
LNPSLSDLKNIIYDSGKCGEKMPFLDPGGFAGQSLKCVNGCNPGCRLLEGRKLVSVITVVLFQCHQNKTSAIHVADTQQFFFYWLTNRVPTQIAV